MDSFKCLDDFREDWDNFQIKKMNRELKNEDLVRKMSKLLRAPFFSFALSSPRRATQSLSSP
ncbi:hypothetical protein MTR_0078s0050 [Medicago truncatula]|uniref:Uncharacterized protein n=1 Tax=Medicago truncatula TaxID=3880 RepID=A0A072TH50_MEDTR|nr:hypothetical protein MTR_0078s0050 [Medicago truncatula]